ncbi:MAG: hypothetical protein AB1767_07135 [Bacillota bacterium]
MGEQKKAQARWNNSSDFIIRINSENSEPFHGKVEHVQSGQVHMFKDFVEMLMLIQGKLNQLGFPQPDTELRSWPE